MYSAIQPKICPVTRQISAITIHLQHSENKKHKQYTTHFRSSIHYAFIVAHCTSLRCCFKLELIFIKPCLALPRALAAPAAYQVRERPGRVHAAEAHGVCKARPSDQVLIRTARGSGQRGARQPEPGFEEPHLACLAQPIHHLKPCLTQAVGSPRGSRARRAAVCVYTKWDNWTRCRESDHGENQDTNAHLLSRQR